MTQSDSKSNAPSMGNRSRKSLLRRISELENANRHLRNRVRQLEIAPHASPAPYSDLAGLVHDAIIGRDMGGTIYYWNPAAERAYGYSADEALGQSCDQLLGTRYPEAQVDLVAPLLKEGQREGDVIRITKDGRPVTVNCIWVLRRDEDGAPSAIIEIGSDISHQREMEETLREMEYQFSAFMDQLPAWAFIKDDQGRLLYCNDYFERTFDSPVHEWVGRTDADLWTGELAEKMQQEDARVLRTGESRESFDDVVVNGRPATLLTIKFPLFLHGQQPVVGGISLDISARRRTEEALGRQNELLRGVAENMPVMLLVWSTDGTIHLVNREFERVLGYTANTTPTVAELASKTASGRSPDEMAEALWQTGTGWKDLEIRTRQGLQLETAWATIRLSDGSRIALGLDVTERRRAVKKLSEERRRLFALLNVLPGFVALKDRDCSIRYANQRYVDLFGEPFGRRCHEVQHGRSGRCRVCEMERILSTGKPTNWEWTSPDGRVFHVWGYPFFGAGGEQLVLELGIDITERKMLEAEVVQTSEKLRRSIGRDLHDALGQNLTGLAFLARGLASALSEHDGAQGDTSRQIARLASEAVSHVRALARGLDPVGVQKEGLVASIRELGRHVEEVYGVPCDFQCRQPVFLGGSAAQHLYHIAQEALTNAAKHAQADRIDIELDAEPDGLLLRITDDGRGIDETMNVEASAESGSEGMGLRVMEYRARAVGARLTIEPGTEAGTVVECSLPREAMEKEPPDGETL